MSYKLNHPDSSLEIEVETEQASMYVSQGWQASPHAKPVPLPE